MKGIDRKGCAVRLMMCLLVFMLAACSGGGGAGEFDKAKAGKAIMGSINSDEAQFLKTAGKAIEYKAKEPAATPQQYVTDCKSSKEQDGNLAKLEEKGLVKIGSDRQDGCPSVTFPDKATPYIKKQDKAMLVMLAKVEKVEVSDLGSGKQTRTVKYKAYYTPTPFGEVLLKPASLEEERQADFSLSFDEGWRIN